MPSIINSTSTGIGGIITTGDTDNELVIQTGDTAAITVDASQNVAVAGGLTFNGGVEPASTGKAIAMSIVFG
jgi:hypothetical protein